MVVWTDSRVHKVLEQVKVIFSPKWGEQTHDLDIFSHTPIVLFY